MFSQFHSGGKEESIKWLKTSDIFTLSSQFQEICRSQWQIINSSLHQRVYFSVHPSISLHNISVCIPGFALLLDHYRGFAISELGKSWLLGEEINPDRNSGLRMSWNVLGFTEKMYFQCIEYEEAFLIIELFMLDFWRSSFSPTALMWALLGD